MVRPLLRFVTYRNYFTLTVENLAQLSVAQIQRLEKFASDRRARLDFNTARMRIAKRIDFHGLNQLLALSGIKADTIESEIKRKKDKSSVDPIIGFGKHRGMYYSEIPVEYLLWLKKNYQGHERTALDRELMNRSL